MGRTHIEVRQRVDAPIELVFERITDHEAMRDWPGIGGCVLIQTGEPRNGLGAVRRVKAGGLTLDEEVVQWAPPTRYEYTIIRGLPVEHRGAVTLSEVDGGTEVRWAVTMSSRVPLLAVTVGAFLQNGLGRALRHFARKTAALAAD